MLEILIDSEVICDMIPLIFSWVILLIRFLISTRSVVFQEVCAQDRFLNVGDAEFPFKNSEAQVDGEELVTVHVYA